MSTSYSTDLRIRLIRAYERGDGTYEQVAKRFGVGVATVSRWLRRYRQNGEVSARPRGGNHRPAVDAAGCAQLRNWIRARPDSTLAELTERYAAYSGRRISVMTMWFTLHRMGYTRKKRRWCRASGSAMPRA